MQPTALGLNFILIATNAHILKQKIHNIQDLTKSRRLVLRSSPGKLMNIYKDFMNGRRERNIEAE